MGQVSLRVSGCETAFATPPDKCHRLSFEKQRVRCGRQGIRASVVELDTEFMRMTAVLDKTCEARGPRRLDAASPATLSRNARVTSAELSFSEAEPL